MPLDAVRCPARGLLLDGSLCDRPLSRGRSGSRAASQGISGWCLSAPLSAELVICSARIEVEG